MSSDPILAARLDSLEQNLRRLSDSVKLLERVPLEQVQGEELLTNVSMVIAARAERHRATIRRLRAELAAESGDANERCSSAWEQYADLEDEARLLFSSCLELIGGVAFRDNYGLADSIWRVADAFSVEMCQRALMQRLTYLAIPATQEARRESWVRTIRLRFPEWTIWSLPLMGYELAAAAIGLQRDLDDLRCAQVDRLVAAPRPAVENGAPARERHRRAACDRRVRTLLADALATYMLGPSYVCATIHLRLDPSATGGAGPSSAERAEVVLGCLETLDSENGGAKKDVVAMLEQQWREALERSQPPTTATDEERLADLRERMLPAFIEGFGDILTQVMRFTPRGWDQTSMFENEWRGQLKQREPLQLQLAAGSQIRDILNAAWLLRLDLPAERLDELETAALENCTSLLRMHEQERARGMQRPFAFQG